jgi:hypothetical protein
MVACPWPEEESLRSPLIDDWIGRVRLDPAAAALPEAPDEEL